jgi:hypothetical protein
VSSPSFDLSDEDEITADTLVVDVLALHREVPPLAEPPRATRPGPSPRYLLRIGLAGLSLREGRS